ncbi:outer membrane lipoprotein-sorting protein [Rheinheimera sp. F8]|uniref:outer membrane lipoprotein-sorting protein n=1 Tax=Rheinheimera sp. F8 TaxID=1763998 RepID=UPI000ABF64A8|nr:outer membrane lipoprotein-sorting protein [Rheinheimera sp. F8]
MRTLHHTPRFYLLLGLLFAAATAPLASAQAQAGSSNSEAQALLQRADEVRNPRQSYRVTSTLIEYRNGKEISRNQLAVFTRYEADTRQFRNLIRFLQPRRDNGKLLLKDGADLWFYDPAGKASIRISAQQRLLGQAANGDVVTTDLIRDYSAVQTGTATLQDAEGQSRDTVQLELSARHPDVTYARMQLWLDPANGQSVKAALYAQSGTLLKTAWFRHYKPALGQLRPTETIIIDGLNPQLVTVIQSQDHQAMDVPAQWLQRQALESFNGR